ncbi:hypothetical protein RPC_1459 [Rhodopseudomonas palustris BisB18]|uniref:Uncharacterized protein n=1 Tax=Rhodopseudomonas palustris (strain BisB18) TaxID=316056 RepID=Q219B5_RHOPB
MARRRGGADSRPPPAPGIALFSRRICLIPGTARDSPASPNRRALAARNVALKIAALALPQHQRPQAASPLGAIFEVKSTS